MLVNSIQMVQVPMEDQMGHVSLKAGIHGRVLKCPFENTVNSGVWASLNLWKLKLIYLPTWTQRASRKKFLVCWTEKKPSKIYKVTDVGQSDGGKQHPMEVETIRIRWLDHMNQKSPCDMDYIYFRVGVCLGLQNLKFDKKSFSSNQPVWVWWAEIIV